MRAWKRFIAVLGLGFATVACGSSGTTSETTTPTSTTSATTTTVSTAQLEAMLLTASDVGTGWEVGHAITPDDLNSFAHNIPCADMAINPTIAERLTPTTGRQYQPTDGSSKHVMELILTGDPARLDADLNALFGAMDSCADITATSGATGTLKVDKLDIPALGDQRAAYVMSDREAPGSPTTWYIRNAVVRKGSVAVGLSLTEILATPQDKPTISDDEYIKLLETAVGKING